MAEYALAGRCVRIAAGGFSPDLQKRMPQQKTSDHRVFYFMLEAKAQAALENPASIRQTIPCGNHILARRIHAFFEVFAGKT